MNSLVKIIKVASKFEKLAQVPESFLVSLVEELMFFDPADYPGSSVDANAVREIGRQFHANFVNKDYPGMLENLKAVLDLSRNGGGALYENARTAYDKVKSMIPVPKPPPQIASAQYKLLNELGQLAELSKKWQDFAPAARQQAKDRYQSLSDAIANAREYLEFQEATVSTSKNSSDPAEKAKGLAKERELTAFKNKMDKDIREIEMNIRDFGGTPREVAPPDPNQPESALT